MSERFLVIALIAALCLGGIAIFLVVQPKQNQDPRLGVVVLAPDLRKVCDGTTLLYVGASKGVVANSPECVR